MIRLIAIFFVRIFAGICYRHKIYGKEHFPKGGGIIAGNHASYLDPPLIGISSPDEIHFLARDSLFRFAPFGWLIKRLNTHPVRRGKGNAHAFRQAVDFVNSGKKVVIFPEGRRSPDGSLQGGQLGVGMLVQRTGCQVIPVYLYGTYEAWSAKRKFPKLWGKTACIFGTPLDFSHEKKLDSEVEGKKEAQREIVDKIMAKIAELKQWYLAGAKGSPP